MKSLDYMYKVLSDPMKRNRMRIPVRARVQDYTARYGEPMDIDGMDPFKPQHAIRTYSKKSRDSEKKAPKRSRDCVVCGDSVQIVDLPSLADCDHQPETCTGCYSGWIAAQLQESGWREVKCPGDGCKVQLSYQEIQAYASPKTFQQYDTFITRAAVGDDPNFRWCRACDSVPWAWLYVEYPEESWVRSHDV
ncbi:conserved hypothetical protein [Pyrenophora tritici-repentis Pt-1C-BFP]|uniref:RING-type domain-containing protein n=1 Tax=Pyrenophora tritici-repentis (strain Pt-1C-BFP) TaxID=426418 RepID=B2WB27_PYRTR|nr:uncharacterized protein PTRG_07490 [Pyrenophora tritici-repentis Pt-1C-BFP]EDU50409.1 conserved hypothetical protein [Pyrenophora tritici-repentis Pt-1C-BFP]